MKRIAPFWFNYIRTWILFTIINCREKKIRGIDALDWFVHQIYRNEFVRMAYVWRNKQRSSANASLMDLIQFARGVILRLRKIGRFVLFSQVTYIAAQIDSRTQVVIVCNWLLLSCFIIARVRLKQKEKKWSIVAIYRGAKVGIQKWNVSTKCILLITPTY